MKNKWIWYDALDDEISINNSLPKRKHLHQFVESTPVGDCIVFNCKYKKGETVFAPIVCMELNDGTTMNDSIISLEQLIKFVEQCKYIVSKYDA
jgi:hypothetical protein